MPLDTTVTQCSVCGSRELRRYGCFAPPEDDQATEFAECRRCGTRYLYKRPAPPPEEAPHV